MLKVRYLSKKEAKEIGEAVKALGMSFFPEKAVEIEGAEILLGQGVFVRDGEGHIFPSLIDKRVELLPKAIVDEGARPHILNGANVMRPGIREMDTTIKKGSAVLIRSGQEPIAIGISLFDYEEAIGMNKGVVIKNIHWKGDKIWRAAVEVLKKKP